MSEVQSIGAGPGRPDGVRAAIARAAQRSGIDFDYLLAQARIESSLDPGARAATSSAAGLYQFTRGTWLRTLENHGADHGLDWASAAIANGRVRDPTMRAQILALRFDPQASAVMAAELAGDNAKALAPLLGRAPDAAELYLAHFLGSAGAAKLLAAQQSEPGTSAAAMLPKAAAANRAIFFDGKGAPRSVGAVMELLRGKVMDAMENPSSFFPSRLREGLGVGQSDEFGGVASFTGSPTPNPSRQREGGRTAPLESAAPRPSMAETLRDAFGLASAQGQASAPGFVRAAYGNLRSLGL